MSEAEKKWDIFDKQNGYPFKSKQSREAYKAALRREIEKRIEQAKKIIDETPSGWPSVKLAAQTALKILTEQLELLDTVEP